MADNGDWCTIESDPGVFTELISKIGVSGIQVEELYSLDKDIFEQIKPVFGLIFLFKWRADDKDTRQPLEYYPEDLFFANQVINNACATQAILSILLNIPSTGEGSKIDIGPELKQFKEFTREFSPEVKGLAISNSDLIRTVHNSFARPEPFVLEQEKQRPDKEDEIYHFIAYLPIGDRIYELDGLKAGPIELEKLPSPDAANDSRWLELVAPHIQKRIERYSANEIRFNLMAVIRNRVDVYTERIRELEARLNAIRGGSSDAMDTSEGGGSSNDQEAALIEYEIRDLKDKIAQEENKYNSWKEENIRRRHNYVPFLVNLLKILAEKNKLAPLIESANAKRAATAAASAAATATTMSSKTTNTQ